MQKIIDWLIERLVLHSSQSIPELTPVVKTEDLERIFGKVELPNHEGNHKCAYRTLAEQHEVENTPTNEHLIKCYDCLGYKEWRGYVKECPDYVSIDELTKFYDLFKKINKDEEVKDEENKKDKEK
jgi:hypothetical protein